MADRDDKLTRRELFRRSAVLGAVAAGGGSLLAACGDDGNGGEGELTCTDTSGLKQAQIQTRKSLKYTDTSTKKDQNCANCNFYKAPQQKGGCGTCTVVPGPIHPEGWCSSWAKKQG